MEEQDRADYKTRYKAADGSTELAKPGFFIRLAPSINSFVRSLPPGDRSSWLRKIISEAAQREIDKSS